MSGFVSYASCFLKCPSQVCRLPGPNPDRLGEFSERWLQLLSPRFIFILHLQRIAYCLLMSFEDNLLPLCSESHVSVTLNRGLC